MLVCAKPLYVLRDVCDVYAHVHICVRAITYVHMFERNTRAHLNVRVYASACKNI